MTKCARCGRRNTKRRMYQWLDSLFGLSPWFCRRCYFWILDNWREGADITEFCDATEESND